MSASKPPTIYLTWCPECGRDSRGTFLRREMPHNNQRGQRCSGKPTRLEYRPVIQSPLRGRA